MTNKKKKHSGMWKPGQSGNPKGRSPISQEVKDLKKTRGEELIKTIDRWLFCSTKEEMVAEAAKDNVSALDLCIIRVIMGAASRGDPGRLNALLDRIIGPVSQKIKAEITNPLMKHIGGIPPHLLGDRIEQMLEKRKTIQAEYTELKESE